LSAVTMRPTVTTATNHFQMRTGLIMYGSGPRRYCTTFLQPALGI
jgi:hypothetical protein